MVDFQLLEDKLSYIKSKKHLSLIEDAFTYAKDKHEGQTRKSGEAYIIHPLEVAIVLAEYKADVTTIIAGLLHDTIEDTDATKEEVEELFGLEVASLVEAVTKLDQYKFTATNLEDEKLVRQSQNFQKMLIAMSKDIRVVIVKLADRLNNMRTLNHLSEEKQERIANETMQIYAPLAHRLGMYRIKAELEDTSFKYLNREKYIEISKMISDTKAAREKDIDFMLNEITDLLTKNAIKSDIKGRVKNIYSVHKKMVDRKKDFEEIYDLLALRIIVDSVTECYSTLGVLHTKWIPLPTRFKDYIAMPKPNGYQSVHTAVINSGKTYEIQIRTKEMDQVAEYGIAAHFNYKSGKGKEFSSEVSKKLKWYDELVKFTQETDDESEVVQLMTDDFFNSNVYVFTPNGDIIDLPKGSTPLDFAFRIHTQVGLQTIGAIVNEKIVPLDYHLQTGDICKMRTSKTSIGPNENWLKIVKTSNARSKIKNHLNKQRRDLLIELGKEDFYDTLERKKIELKFTDKDVEKYFSTKGAKTVDDLFYEIGKNTISPGQAINALSGNQQFLSEEQLIKKINDSVYMQSHSDKNIVVDGLKNPKIKLSLCCNPIPGDNITGYISKGAGIVVHRTSCPNLKSLDNNRFIEVFWGSDKTKLYVVHLRINAFNKDNIVGDIINRITSSQGKVTKISAQASTASDAEIALSMTVKNKEELNTIITSLNNNGDIYSIERLYNE